MSADPYFAKVLAFIEANRLQLVDDDKRASLTPFNAVPWVDPRSLIFSPSSDVDDVVRDAILLKLANIKDPTPEDLARLKEIYVRIKLDLAEELVKRLLLEVKR